MRANKITTKQRTILGYLRVAYLEVIGYLNTSIRGNNQPSLKLKHVKYKTIGKDRNSYKFS